MKNFKDIKRTFDVYKHWLFGRLVSLANGPLVALFTPKDSLLELTQFVWFHLCLSPVKCFSRQFCLAQSKTTLVFWQVVMLYNFTQGSRILVLVLNEVVSEHLKISILIHTLTHNMKHQKATRLLLRTSLMNRLILIALSQESLALSWLDNNDA